jgi:hypothetical protein
MPCHHSGAKRLSWIRPRSVPPRQFNLPVLLPSYFDLTAGLLRSYKLDISRRVAFPYILVYSQRSRLLLLPWALLDIFSPQFTTDEAGLRKTPLLHTTVCSSNGKYHNECHGNSNDNKQVRQGDQHRTFSLPLSALHRASVANNGPGQAPNQHLQRCQRCLQPEKGCFTGGIPSTS